MDGVLLFEDLPECHQVRGALTFPSTPSGPRLSKMRKWRRFLRDWDSEELLKIKLNLIFCTYQGTHLSLLRPIGKFGFLWKTDLVS